MHPDKSHNSCEPGYIFNSSAVPEPESSVYDTIMFQEQQQQQQQQQQQALNEIKQEIENDDGPGAKRKHTVISNETTEQTSRKRKRKNDFVLNLNKKLHQKQTSAHAQQQQSKSVMAIEPSSISPPSSHKSSSSDTSCTTQTNYLNLAAAAAFLHRMNTTANAYFKHQFNSTSQNPLNLSLKPDDDDDNDEDDDNDVDNDNDDVDDYANANPLDNNTDYMHQHMNSRTNEETTDINSDPTTHIDTIPIASNKRPTKRITRETQTNSSNHVSSVLSNTASDDMSFKCTYCSITFLDYELYSLHVGMHGTNNPWQCSVCSNVCLNKVDFSAHILHLPKLKN
jgi:hypothetical protein